LASLGTWPVQAAVILICLSGSIPLTFYHRVYRDGLRYTTEVLQLHGVLIIGLLVTLLFGMCMWRSSVGSWAQVFHHAPLMAFSAQTTAGFSSMDLSNLDAASKLVLILSMAIGGGIGSTAGGFKILRLLITVRMIQLMILRTCLPRHAVLSPRLTGRRLEENEIREAMLIILLFMIVILISWFAFLSMGYEPIDSLFEVVSATGTVGLSVGIIGPDLPALLKGIICADMLMGRLEIVAWLVMFYPGTWFGRRREAA
jgi:trk system potassium uptake protein TrkH